MSPCNELKQRIVFPLAAMAMFCAQATSAAGLSENQIEVFAPGIISARGTVEYYPTFSPDGSQIWFVRASEFSLAASKTVYTAKRQGESWTEPEVASFSGTWNDTDPFVSPDGKTLFFSSNRPLHVAVAGEDFDLWMVEREDEVWASPIHLGAQVNSDTPEHSPVVTADGTLYFRSSRAGGMGQGDLYLSRRDGAAYSTPENLGQIINTPKGEWYCLVHPDGDFIIFEASGRAKNLSPPGDLYLSFRRTDGWSQSVPLTLLNSHYSDLAARLSSDRKWLYFSSNRAPDNDVDIYRVPLQTVLESL